MVRPVTFDRHGLGVDSWLGRTYSQTKFMGRSREISDMRVGRYRRYSRAVPFIMDVQTHEAFIGLLTSNWIG